MYRQVSEGLTEREVEDELVILQPATGNVHQLNRVAAFLWRNLQQSTDGDMLIAKVAEHFEIDKATAAADIELFLADLTALQLIETI